MHNSYLDNFKNLSLIALSFYTGNAIAQKKPIFDRPNILLIMADDMGYSDIGCYGSEIVTPNIDRLAANGLSFRNFYNNAKSCPTRASLLTGLYNHEAGMGSGAMNAYEVIKPGPYQGFLNKNRVTIAEVLKSAGYATYMSGKWHLGERKEVWPLQRGFDKYFGLISGVSSYFEIVQEPTLRVMANGNESWNPPPDNFYMTQALSDTAVAYLKSHFKNEKKKPFFLYFCTDDPHRSLPFDSWPGPNPFGNRKEGYPGVTPVVFDPDSVIVPYFLPDIPACRAELAQYYQAISRLDQGVGKLISFLKDADKYENTLIIYISDNGIAFPGAKTTLYDPGMKLPCIVKLPVEENKGKLTDAMVSWVDITPTILDYAGGLPSDNEFQGRSFKKILENPGKIDDWDEVYASHSFHEITMYYPMRVVRTKKFKMIWNIAYKLDYPFAWDLYESSTWQGLRAIGSIYLGTRMIENFIHRAEFELYDLENDPEELVNLSSVPHYAGILEALKVKIKDFQKRTGDPWFYKWEYE